MSQERKLSPSASATDESKRTLSAEEALRRLQIENADLRARVCEVTTAFEDSLRSGIVWFDALAAHICVLNESGVIVATNKAWRDFAVVNGGDHEHLCNGANYLQVCDGSKGTSSDEASAMARGIRALISRKIDEFEIEYPCHSRAEKRWFRCSCRRLPGDGLPYVVLSHKNITDAKLAQLELQRTKDVFESVANLAPVGILQTDALGVVTYVNARWCQIAGLMPERVLGMRWDAGLHPEDRDRIEQEWFAAAEHDRALSSECRYLHPSGERVWTLAQAVAFKDPHANTPGFIATLSDITERKRSEDALRSSESRYRSLFENMAAGFAYCRMMYDADLPVDCVYLEVNNAFSNLAGPRNVSGRRVSEVIPDIRQSDPELFKAYGRVAAGGKPERFEMYVAGLKKWFAISVYSPEKGYFAAVFDVIDDRKRAEIELRRHRDRLEELVTERTRELEAGNAQLAAEMIVRRRAEHAMRQVEERLHLLVDGVKDYALFLLDPMGNVLTWNSGAQRLLGYRESEIIGQNISRFYTEPDAAALTPERELDHARKHGRFEVEGERVRKDGIHFWAHVVSTALYTDLGEVRGFARVVRDVTERRRTEDQLRKLSSAMEQSPATVIITDLHGTIEYVNPAFEHQSGFNVKEAIGLRPSVLKSGVHDDVFYREMWRTIQSGKIWRGELCNRNKSGALFWESATISPFRNTEGLITHYVAIKQDITEQRRIGEELRGAKEAADASNQAKSNFLATMSHEIRTPISAILNLNYLLQQTQLTPAQEKYTAKINLSARNLLGIISDILDFSKIEAGRIDLERVEFDFETVLDSVIQIAHVQSQQKSLEVNLEVANELPAKLVGDALRLEQVLLNLVNNAVKFTERGRITIFVEALDGTDAESIALRFSVTDTGIGMTPQQVGMLFNSFSQADTSTARHYGGTGLGLAISQRYVALMGGEIAVESRLGEGSTFSFVAKFGERKAFGKRISSGMRVVKTRLRPEKPTLLLDPVLRGARILLVEDNEINQLVATEILGLAECKVTVASRGREALDTIFDASGKPGFDAVLMDLQMPGIDGFETTRQIRADPRFTRLLIIAMTADAIAGVKEECLKAGMNDYLSKPVKPEELFATLSRWLKKKSEIALALSSPEALAKPAAETRAQTATPVPEARGVAFTEFEAGLLRIGGKRDLYKRLLKQFRDKYTPASQGLDEALARGDRETAHRLLHTVKGVAGNLGFGVLSAAAMELESRVKAGQEADGTARELFRSALSDTVAGIAGFLDKESN